MVRRLGGAANRERSENATSRVATWYKCQKRSSPGVVGQKVCQLMKSRQCSIQEVGFMRILRENIYILSYQPSLDCWRKRYCDSNMVTMVSIPGCTCTSFYLISQIGIQ